MLLNVFTASSPRRSFTWSHCTQCSQCCHPSPVKGSGTPLKPGSCLAECFHGSSAWVGTSILASTEDRAFCQGIPQLSFSWEGDNQWLSSPLPREMRHKLLWHVVCLLWSLVLPRQVLQVWGWLQFLCQCSGFVSISHKSCRLLTHVSGALAFPCLRKTNCLLQSATPPQARPSLQQLPLVTGRIQTVQLDLEGKREWATLLVRGKIPKHCCKLYLWEQKYLILIYVIFM